MVWSLEDNPLNHREVEIYKYLKRTSDNAKFAQTVSRFVDLREYLDTHTFESAAELRKNIVSHGVPIFSNPESEQLFKLTAKTGGGPDVDLIDNVVRQWLSFLYEWQPAFLKDGVDIVSPFVFIAATLERLPVVGPMYTIALNSITATLPVIAASIENITPELIGFLPIPEAGPVGNIIGWMIASQFVILAMLINISREHFGQAFIISFLSIPFLGTSLYNAALSGEKFLKKSVSERSRLIDSTETLFGKPTAAVVDAVVPDPLATGDEPKRDLPSLKSLGLPTLHDIADRIEGPEGGKRLSSRGHSKGKWRTQRKLR